MTMKGINEELGQLPEGYKMTELGPLPEDWRVVRLGDIFLPVPKKQREVHIRENEIYRLLTVRLYAKGVTLRAEQCGVRIGTKTLYKTMRGDFIFSKIDARNGAWGFVNEDLAGGLVSGDFPILRLVQEIADPHFLEFLLSRSIFWKTLGNFAVGTTNRRRLQVSQFLSLSIPLPPLPEQRAIAYVLRTVQEAKEAAERAIAALRQLKKSLMRHLFTYGPVPLDQAESVPLRDSELGPIPEHWQVVRLGDVGKVVTGRTPSTSVAEYWNGAIPFITPVDLRGGPIGHAARFITEAGLKQAKPLPRGAVLVSCIGYIGKVGVVETDIAVTNQQINAIIPYRCENWFLAYALMQETNILKSRARMTTVPILHKTNFENIPIPLPPPAEQQEIARILQTVDRRIQAEENCKQALEALFKTLLQDLMTARRRLPREFIARFSDAPDK